MPTSHRLRAIAPAVAGVIAATALLSGCLGDDKDDKGAKAPSVSSTASSPAKSASPSDKPGGTKKPTGSASASADVIDAFKYKVGQCINMTGTKTDEVSCTKPHDGQVGKTFDLPSTVTPDTPGYADKVGDLCEGYLSPIIKRQPASPQLSFSYTYPLDMDAWNAGEHGAACIIERQDEKPLTTVIK
ncbi:septum formation family protein [Embleya sp. NBC_00896]|uniref:septum formation family protein n=1 Tax=Embleya sp. NBC_00896 TaxID=2975961 RepID=UPI002F9140AE|nr:septum formation family protein [Embleya sp. NBC_00896]